MFYNFTFLLGLTALVVVVQLLAYTLGWFFTEIVLLPLRFKPFSCRACLSFWLTFAGNAALPIVFYSALRDCGVYLLFGLASVQYAGMAVGVIMGLLNYLYIKSKFIIYD